MPHMIERGNGRQLRYFTRMISVSQVFQKTLQIKRIDISYLYRGVIGDYRRYTSTNAYDSRVSTRSVLHCDKYR